MKTLKNKFWALLLITSVAFLSCKKEDPLSPMASYNNNNTNQEPAPVNQYAWKINSYQTGEKSATELFSQYRFKIADDVIEAYTNNMVEIGKWTMLKKNVTITFASKGILNELNSEWTIIDNTESDIRLQRTNREGQIVNLSFKNLSKIIEVPKQNDVPDNVGIPRNLDGSPAVQ